MPNIFLYTDYRKFIKDWYDEKKRQDTGVTYRTIARAVGFNSPAHITMVLKKKTNLSNAHLIKFSDVMKLRKKESDYFSLLVNYNQSKLTVDKKFFFDKMVKFKEIGTTLLNPDQYEYYRKWYYAVIHDILSFYPFKGDCRELAKMVEPSITPREAQKAVALLERLRFIIKKDDGSYQCAHPGISAYSEGHSLALSVYAADMIDRAKSALEKLPGDERAVSWAGFSMSKKIFEKVKEETRLFRKHIIALAQADDAPDRAYHINMQIFPVSKRYARSSNGGIEK